jgi:hypothetical protein
MGRLSARADRTLPPIGCRAPASRSLRHSYLTDDYHDLLLVDTAGNVVFSLVEAPGSAQPEARPYRDSQLAKGYADDADPKAIDPF